jgi:hypothetical protein
MSERAADLLGNGPKRGAITYRAKLQLSFKYEPGH